MVASTLLRQRRPEFRAFSEVAGRDSNPRPSGYEAYHKRAGREHTGRAMLLLVQMGRIIEVADTSALPGVSGRPPSRRRRDRESPSARPMLTAVETLAIADKRSSVTVEEENKSLPRIAFAPTDGLQPRFDRVQARDDLIELGVDPVGFRACEAATGGFDER